MIRRISKSEHRAMADALRHMRGAGVRSSDIMSAGADPKQIARSLSRIAVPRRDGITGSNPTLVVVDELGAVSPRHVGLPRAGDLLPETAGVDGLAPVAPASFAGGEHGGDQFGKAGTSVGLGHGAQSAAQNRARHGAKQGRAVP